MKKFSVILSTRTATVICIAIAIASRIVNLLYVSFAGRDKMFLVMQSKSLLDGNGLSIPQYFISNIETPVYDFTPLWPPGYPILLAPFLKLFNYNIYWSTTTLDIIACMAFIFLTRKLVLHLNFPVAAANIITLLAGCFEYPFIYESLPTDTISLVFFLAGILLLLQAATTEKFSPGKLLLTAFFLFLPCAFRYSYPPLTVAAPLAIIFTGLINRNRLLVKKGILVFMVACVLMIIFTLFLKASTGSASYILKTERGFFPENLVHWHPFGPASFINLPFLTSQVIKITGLGLPQIMIILEIINVIMVLFFIGFFLYPYLKKWLLAQSNSFSLFLVTGFFISAAIFFSLGYLSFTYQIQKQFQYGWNYIGESRYYAFIHVFLQIGFVGWIFLYPAWKKSLLQSVFVFACSVLLFIEITHNIYFNTKVAFNFREYKSAHYKELDYVYFNSLINSVITKNPDAEIIVMSDNDHYNPYMAAYLGKKGVFDAINLNKRLPSVKKRTILLLVLYDDEIPAYKDFLSNNNVRFLNRVITSNYYLLEMNPQ